MESIFSEWTKDKNIKKSIGKIKLSSNPDLTEKGFEFIFKGL